MFPSCSKRSKTKGNQVRNIKFWEAQGILIPNNFYFEKHQLLDYLNNIQPNSIPLFWINYNVKIQQFVIVSLTEHLLSAPTAISLASFMKRATSKSHFKYMGEK